MCKAHSITREHHSNKIGVLKNRWDGGGRWWWTYLQIYCFGLVSSILDPQEGTIAYHSPNGSLMKCVSIQTIFLTMTYL